MNLVILGANGRTGLLLVRKALERGYSVTAYVRRMRSLPMEHPRLRVVIGNLDETLRLRDAIQGADACISAIGGRSTRKRCPDFIEGIYRIISTMEMEDVRRLVYISILGAGESRYCFPQPMRFFITNLLVAKPIADHAINEQRIENSNLDWTIVRPGALTDGEETGRYQHNWKRKRLHSKPRISRADLAEFVLNQLTDDTYLYKSPWIYE